MAKCVDGFEEKYIAVRLEDQATRRAKYGNSACMQEPNIKNGCGGLRDYPESALDGVFQIPHPHARANWNSGNSSANPNANSSKPPMIFFCAHERSCIIMSTARWTFWAKTSSPPSRTNLGYHDRSPSLRMEKFMRDLYTHMRNIDLITRTLEQRMALLPRADAGFRLRA